MCHFPDTKCFPFNKDNTMLIVRQDQTRACIVQVHHMAFRTGCANAKYGGSYHVDTVNQKKIRPLLEKYN